MGLRLIQTIRGFTEGGRFDWLHPSHGRFPDFAAEYKNEHDEQFVALVWDDGFSWVAMVQGPDWYHGGYPHSYRWWPNGPEPTTIWCRPSKGLVYDVDLQWSERSKILKQVATASVHTHIMTEAYPEGWA
jgi:hypothetical protein